MKKLLTIIPFITLLSHATEKSHFFPQPAPHTLQKERNSWDICGSLQDDFQHENFNTYKRSLTVCSPSSSKPFLTIKQFHRHWRSSPITTYIEVSLKEVKLKKPEKLMESEYIFIHNGIATPKRPGVPFHIDDRYNPIHLSALSTFLKIVYDEASIPTGFMQKIIAELKRGGLDIEDFLANPLQTA